MNSQKSTVPPHFPLGDSRETFADVYARLDHSERRLSRAEAQGRRYRIAGGVLVAVITVALVAPVVSPAVAQGYGVTLATLNTRLTTTESKIATAESNIKSLQQSDAKQQDDIAKLTTLEKRDVTDLTTSITALQTKTASMSVLTDSNTSQSTVRFTNVNVQVVSGSGSTNGTINGRGNLIVGYNEGIFRSRIGSHNLITGTFNNYNGSGGVVFGSLNTINGNYCCVSGGRGNEASGSQSSISGGQDIMQSADAGGSGGAGTYHFP